MVNVNNINRTYCIEMLQMMINILTLKTKEKIISLS